MAAAPARVVIALATLVLTFVLGSASPLRARRAGGPAGAQPAAAQSPKRIVSLIPATTEMLFAMGAGDRVVGAGAYDRYPPEVSRIPRVGGLIDPDTEQIIALKPDLVIVYATQAELRARLDRARIPYFAYEHRALPDILQSIRAIGQRVGAAGSAETVAADMERRLDEIRRSAAGRPRPRTLLVFDRDPGTLRNIYASGGYGFLADLLIMAGGDNVFADINRQSVQASTEMILARRPELIIELRYGDRVEPLDAKRYAALWSILPSVPAVRQNRLHVLVGDEFVVPGPRIVLAAERLAKTIQLK
jgi:iron complex transport system substrate-binding protein